MEDFKKGPCTIAEVTSQEDLDSYCLGIKNEICVIGFIAKEDGVPESIKKFEQHFSVFKEVSGNFEAIRFMWTNPLKHTGL